MTTLTRSPRPPLLRRSGALLVLTAGAFHVWLWFHYFHTVHVVGTLFLLNGAAALAVVVLLVLTDGRLAPVAGLGYSLGTLVAFAVSVAVGLFGFHESLWGPWQVAAGAVELAAVLVLWVAAAQEGRTDRKVPTR
jgi:hypothetical protein